MLLITGLSKEEKRGQSKFPVTIVSHKLLRPLFRWSYPLPVVFGLRTSPVDFQSAVLADGVGTVEDPVLPGGEAPEDARQHGLGAGEAQARLHAGERVGDRLARS